MITFAKRTVYDAAYVYADTLQLEQYQPLKELLTDWSMEKTRYQRHDIHNKPIWTPLSYWLGVKGLSIQYQQSLKQVCERYNIPKDDSSWVAIGASELLKGHQISCHDTR